MSSSLSQVVWVVWCLLSLYLLVLLVRVVLDWVRFFARSWRPRGVVLVLAITKIGRASCRERV